MAYMKFKHSNRIQRKLDFRDFEYGTVAGGRQAGWNYWDFQAQTSLGFMENGL